MFFNPLWNIIHHTWTDMDKLTTWYLFLAPPLDLQQPQCHPKRVWSKTEKRVSWTSCLAKRRHSRRRLNLPSPSRFWRRQCGRIHRVLGSRWSSTRRRWSKPRHEGPTSWLPMVSNILWHVILRAEKSDEIKMENKRSFSSLFKSRWRAKHAVKTFLIFFCFLATPLAFF